MLSGGQAEVAVGNALLEGADGGGVESLRGLTCLSLLPVLKSLAEFSDRGSW